MNAPAITLPDGVGYAADKGARENQEDCLDMRMLREGVLAFVLCDGMGGHAAGEVASGEAVRAFLGHLDGFRQAGPDTWEALLERALVAANDAIRARIVQDDQLNGMGCTLVGVISDGKRFAYVSVGDSPLYLSTFAAAGGKGGAHRLVRVNTDHSLREVVERKARETGQSFETIAAQINPNALRSALVGQLLDTAQMRKDNELDLGHGELHVGDRLIAASDGIETLLDDDLARLAEHRETQPHAQAQMLLQQVIAAAKPGQDNTSVIVYAASPAASPLDGGPLGGMRPATDGDQVATSPIGGAQATADAERDTHVIPVAPAPKLQGASGALDAKRRLQTAPAQARNGGAWRWGLLVFGVLVLAGVLAYVVQLLAAPKPAQPLTQSPPPTAIAPPPEELKGSSSPEDPPPAGGARKFVNPDFPPSESAPATATGEASPPAPPPERR